MALDDIARATLSNLRAAMRARRDLTVAQLITASIGRSNPFYIEDRELTEKLGAMTSASVGFVPMAVIRTQEDETELLLLLTTALMVRPGQRVGQVLVNIGKRAGFDGHNFHLVTDEALYCALVEDEQLTASV